MNYDPEAERVDNCYHEAAHAVFHYHAGLKINWVRATVEGNAEIEWPTEPSPPQCVPLAAGCVAPWYAEDWQRGETRRHYTFQEFESLAESEGQFFVDAHAPVELLPDSFTALELLRSAAPRPDGTEDLYREMCGYVDENLNAWWPEVVAVAEGLKDTGYLDGSEVVKLIESANHGEENEDA